MIEKHISALSASSNKENVSDNVQPRGLAALRSVKGPPLEDSPPTKEARAALHHTEESQAEDAPPAREDIAALRLMWNTRAEAVEGSSPTREARTALRHTGESQAKDAPPAREDMAALRLMWNTRAEESSTKIVCNERKPANGEITMSNQEPCCRGFLCFHVLLVLPNRKGLRMRCSKDLLTLLVQCVAITTYCNRDTMQTRTHVYSLADFSLQEHPKESLRPKNGCICIFKLAVIIVF